MKHKHSVRIIPFGENYLETASKLVAARYEKELSREPLLPPGYAEPAAVTPFLRKHLQKGPGVTALQDGVFAGFLLSHVFQFRDEWIAWIPDSGHGVAAGHDIRHIYRKMYASIASQWLDKNCRMHLVSLLSHEETAKNAWFSIEFGLTVIDCVRDLEPADGAKQNVEIVPARKEDIDVLCSFEQELQNHLILSPIFLRSRDYDKRTKWKKWIEDPVKQVWIAFYEGNPVGYLSGDSTADAGPVMPRCSDKLFNVCQAYVKQDKRFTGIGTALLNHALNWAEINKFDSCAVDFESSNIPGSQFWFSKKFRPVVHSLKRVISRW